MSIPHTRCTTSTSSSTSSTRTTSPENRNGGCPRRRYGNERGGLACSKQQFRAPEDHTPSVRLLNGLRDQAATTSAGNHPRFSRTTGRHRQGHRGLLRDLAQDRCLARHGPGARRDALNQRLPTRCHWCGSHLACGLENSVLASPLPAPALISRMWAIDSAQPHPLTSKSRESACQCRCVAPIVPITSPQRLIAATQSVTSLIVRLTARRWAHRATIGRSEHRQRRRGRDLATSGKSPTPHLFHPRRARPPDSCPSIKAHAPQVQPEFLMIEPAACWPATDAGGCPDG